MLIILQTFKEDNEAIILFINSLMKETPSSDAERRFNGIRLMSSNDLYLFIYPHVQKGMNDLNPLVRRSSYAGLLKLKNISQIVSTQTDVAESEDSEEEEEEEDEPKEENEEKKVMMISALGSSETQGIMFLNWRKK